MPHMPATGVSGIDLYATDNNGQERWCAGNYSMGDTIVYNFRGLSYAAKSGNGFEYQLFLPLYNSVSWMEIGVPADASFRFLPVQYIAPCHARTRSTGSLRNGSAVYDQRLFL